MQADNSTSKGSAAEDAALVWLQDRGLCLVDRNYRRKTGEIDLIMRERNVLVFVEVRLRSNPDHMSGAESITRRKMQRLIRTATFYLQNHPQAADTEFRFDVISMGTGIDWIKNAFTLDTWL